MQSSAHRRLRFRLKYRMLRVKKSYPRFCGSRSNLVQLSACFKYSARMRKATSRMFPIRRKTGLFGWHKLWVDRSSCPEPEADFSQGEWKSIARLESVLDIRTKYFESALSLLEHDKGISAGDALATVASKYAKFAASNYRASAQQVGEIDRLEAFSRRKAAESRPTINGRSTDSSDDSASKRALAIAQSQQDRQTVDSFRESRRLLLETALSMFGRSLSLSDNNDDALFEFASLWMENASDDTVNQIVNGAVPNIPSHKFTHLIHQLSARLAADTSAQASPNRASFQDVLFNVVSRVSREHPFHSLYQIFFLRTTASLTKSTVSRRISAAQPQAASQAQVQRAAAVSQILQDLRKEERLRAIVQILESVLSAYTAWAAFPLDRKNASRRGRMIPTDQPIIKLSNLPIPITTYTLPLDKSLKYDPSTFPCIKGFKSSFITAGGLHLPKITECQGTDGRVYKQLVGLQTQKMLSSIADTSPVQGR